MMECVLDWQGLITAFTAIVWVIAFFGMMALLGWMTG